MTDKKDIKHILLLMTYQCNLHCVYCYERHKSGKTMDVDDAKRYLIAEMDQIAREGRYKEVELSFMGGEPLMAFYSIRTIAEWWWQQEWAVPSVLFATTNGTLINDDMKCWLAAHKDRFCLGLSFDGNETMQNTNRSGSAASIDLDFFRDTWPDQPPKFTISPQSVGDLANGIIYLHQRGFDKISANIAYGVEWTDESVATYAQQLRKLADYYVEHPQQARCSLLDLELKEAMTYDDDEHTKHCGCGEGTVLIDTDGKRYPCQMFAPITTDSEKVSEVLRKDFSDIENFIVEKCRHCVLRNCCSRCYGINFLEHGDMRKQSDYLCRTFKIQFLTNCYLAQRLLEEHLIEEEEEELRETLEIADLLFKIDK